MISKIRKVICPKNHQRRAMIRHRQVGQDDAGHEVRRRRFHRPILMSTLSKSRSVLKIPQKSIVK